jgi:protein-serine/threonine kinase
METAAPLVVRKSKQVFAMKVIRKSDMLRNSQEGHLRAERDFLVASENSKWVVPLIASFQDNNNLYLVMEYMVGGDFLGLLLREDILDENVAKWYIAEMILCIEEAHRMSWIHRDIKPDNFLITASGHLKISDFGLAFDGHWAHNQVSVPWTRRNNSICC